MDLQTVTTRAVALLSGGRGDGPLHREATAELTRRARELMGQPFERFEWSDPEEERVNERLNRYLSGIRTLAEAWARPGGPHWGDAEVLSRVLAGLDCALEHFAPHTPRPGNWYYWLIQIPDKLGAIGLLLGDELPPALQRRLVESLEHELGDMVLSGANAAWEARNHSYLALLQGDGQHLSRAATRIFDTVRYSSDGGVREDYSYLFHGHIPYAGVYGAGFAQTVAQFMFLFDGTQWAAAAARRELLANLLLEHFQWFVVAGSWDPLVCGRAYEARRSAGGALEAMLYMTRVDHPRRDEVAAAARALMAGGAAPDPRIAGLADTLGAVEARPARGFRYWYTADLGAYVADDYHVSFRQFSRRVQDYEYLTGLGATGWTLAYGFTHISRSGRELYNGESGDRPIDVYDWDRLPGTTNRVGAHPDNRRPEQDAAGQSSFGHSLNFGRGGFSGGAWLASAPSEPWGLEGERPSGEALEEEPPACGEPTDGSLANGGAAAFILVPTNGDFVARKSLTFFPGGFVALGSGISSTASGEQRPVQTTVLQWATDEETAPLVLSGGLRPQLTAEPRILVGVRWCLVDGVGAVFYESAKIRARRVGRVTTIWLDHGPEPVDAGYAYAVLPSTSAAELEDFASSPPVRPLRRDREIHAVIDELTGSTAATFFEAGAAAGLAADAPAIVYWRATEREGALAVQNPLHTTAPVTVTLPLAEDARLRPVDAEVRRGAPRGGRLTVQVSTALGRIYRAGAYASASACPSANLAAGADPERGDPRLAAVPRRDLAGLYAFHVTADSDAEQVILTAHVGDELAAEGYELSLEGHKGHLLHVFTEPDVVDRPGPGVARYRWRHGQGQAPTTGNRGGDQVDGDFRVVLRTEMEMATAYITVPRFDGDRHPTFPTDLPRDVNRTPR